MRKSQTPSLRNCIICDKEFLSLTSGKICSDECRREWQREYTRQHYKDKPNLYLLYSIRSRCSEKGIPFNLDLEDINIPSHCPVLGIPLFRNSGGNKPTGNSPSVDRINPLLGYTKGNVQVISQRANVMKNDASREELLKFADWINASFR